MLLTSLSLANTTPLPFSLLLFSFWTKWHLRIIIFKTLEEKNPYSPSLTLYTFSPVLLMSTLISSSVKRFIIIFELLLTHPSSTLLENPISSTVKSSAHFLERIAALSYLHMNAFPLSAATTWLLSNISVLSVMSTPHRKMLHKDMQPMRTEERAQLLKSTGCSSRSPGLGSHQPPGSYQLSNIPVPGNLISFFNSMGTSHACGAHNYMQAIHLNACS